jgi:hypothetical protein
MHVFGSYPARKRQRSLICSIICAGTPLFLQNKTPVRRNGLSVSINRTDQDFSADNVEKIVEGKIAKLAPGIYRQLNDLHTLALLKQSI